MIYAAIREDAEPLPTIYRFRDWNEYRRETWSPERTVEAVASTEIGGTRSRDRTGLKWRTRARLAEIQEVMQTPGLSWAELADLQNVAEKLARRAGLIREARENGII